MHFRSRSCQEGPFKMRKYLCLASAVVALAATIILTPLSAGAATPATFTLTAGALSISAPTASVSLGSQVASTSSSTITGSLGVVTVTDQRGGTTTWTTSVISTAFTPPAGPADPASNVSYGAGPITVSATVVATAVRSNGSDWCLDGRHGREHRNQHRELEPDHLRRRAGELCPGRLLGHHHPLGRLSEERTYRARSPDRPIAACRYRGHCPDVQCVRVTGQSGPPQLQAASGSVSSPSRVHRSKTPSPVRTSSMRWHRGRGLLAVWRSTTTPARALLWRCTRPPPASFGATLPSLR
jgi:hypothetical protein